MALIISAGLVLAALPAHAQSNPVVPGRSIGLFHLGDSVEIVSEMLGPPLPPALLPQAVLSYHWPLRHLGALVDVVTRKIVALSGSDDAGYRTAGGLGVGSSPNAIRSAYGRAETVDYGDGAIMLVYDRAGVAFLIDHAAGKGDRVSTVFVFARGTYRDIFPVTALAGRR